MAVTKEDLADELVRQIGLSRRDAGELVNQIFDQISLQLSQGKEVKLWGFGKFEVRSKRARSGCDPNTGESIAIAAHKMVTFTASLKLKEFIANDVAVKN